MNVEKEYTVIKYSHHVSWRDFDKTACVHEQENLLESSDYLSNPVDITWCIFMRNQSNTPRFLPVICDGPGSDLPTVAGPLCRCASFLLYHSFNVTSWA